MRAIFTSHTFKETFYIDNNVIQTQRYTAFPAATSNFSITTSSLGLDVSNKDKDSLNPLPHAS